MNNRSTQPRRRAALQGAARLRDAATGGTAGRKRLPFPLFLVLVTVAVTITSTAVRAFSSPAGKSWVNGASLGVLNFLDYFMGVVTLISLTGSVVWGLISTNQSVLKPYQRVFSQSVHRGISTAALAALLLHIVVKISFGEAAPIDGVIPLGGVGTPVAVGLGTVAAYLMVGVAVTGILRSRFAHGRYPWIWRPVHAMGYASWLIGLAHGLTAGRPGKWYVLWGYGLCVAAVALAVLVRALGNTGKSAAELESTRKLMARDLMVASSGAAERRPAAGRDGSSRGQAARDIPLTRDSPIPGSSAPEPEAPSAPEPTTVMPTAPLYAAEQAEPAQPMYQQPVQQPMAPQPVAQQPQAPQPPMPQPVAQQPQAPQPVPLQQPVPVMQSASVLDTGEIAARFAAEWDTGELNALLDVGRQQYAEAQAAGVPYTGDPYTAAQYAGPQYSAGQYGAGQYSAGQYGSAQYGSAQYTGPQYAQPQPPAAPAPGPVPQQPSAGYPYAAGPYPAAQAGYPADPFATGSFPQVQTPGVTLGAAAAPLQYFPPAPADPFATGSFPQVSAAGYGYPANPDPAAPGAGPAYRSVPAAYSADPWQAR
ncbi:hypothetical protein [Peterkaempfera sp. SMS 1(5)a]|uniref:hypothetical protein n=1 Tax=Peterkaempfera podocarpi TaxID=3232308 RepID=UPI00366CAC2C